MISVEIQDNKPLPEFRLPMVVWDKEYETHWLVTNLGLSDEELVWTRICGDHVSSSFISTIPSHRAENKIAFKKLYGERYIPVDMHIVIKEER